MNKENLIKVRFVNNGNTESMWAEKLEGNRAKICNIPFFGDEISLDDIVEIENVSEDDYNYWKIIKVLENKTCKVFITYDAQNDFEIAKKKYANIYHALASCDGRIEGAVPGFAVAAFDYNTEQSKIFDVMESISDIKEWGYAKKPCSKE